MRKYYIFGAHSRGQSLWIYLRTLHPEWEMLGFIYDNDEENKESIDNISVINLKRAPGSGEANSEKPAACLDTTATVYIATRGIYHDEISQNIKNYGFTEIIPVDVELDNLLRNEFIPRYFKEHGRMYKRLENSAIHDSKFDDSKIDDSKISDFQTALSAEQNALIYVVRSLADSRLSEDKDLNDYEAYIQAGTSVGDAPGCAHIDSCVFFDNKGDNISLKNPQMCELTAMYWIWKNAKEDVVGIEHYRRRFILPDGWESVFGTKNANELRKAAKVGRFKADVILPTPLYVHPSLELNYCERHVKHIWESMLKSLAGIHPDCADAARHFFSGTGCYSPCNMLIARREVFIDMCSWLFPVLFDVMDKCGTISDKYQNRYPGFLAERLITFYFFHKEKELNILYADKVFLI